MAETRSLSGTVIAITGATSGIGLATATALVQEGARVALLARDGSRLAAVVSELGADSALAVAGDVRDPAASQALVRDAVDRWGRLDSIIPNAGIGMYGGILDHSDDDLRTMLDTNINGTIWAIRAAVRQFREQEAGGDIVIVSSVAGFRGGAGEAVYAASKFAQVGLAGAIEREVTDEGIRVTSICPASTRTAFALGAGRTEGDDGRGEYLDPDDVAAAITTVLRQPRRMRSSIWTMWSMAEVV